MARQGTFRGQPVQMLDPAAVERALTAAGVAVLATAGPYVPRDTGELAESAAFQVEGRRVTIGFKDSKAVAVHEDLESDFTIGGPKFLERALNESRGRLSRLIADELRKGLR